MRALLDTISGAAFCFALIAEGELMDTFWIIPWPFYSGTASMKVKVH
ncbi:MULTISPECIES: hypothetical protein [unclassified Peribacillus]|nr:hypothetical protein [Peribacillus sp. Bi96]